MVHFVSFRPLAILLLVLLLPALAAAQGFFRPMQGAQSGRFIEAPRNVQQQLRDAERALQEGRQSDAVVRLGDLLAREGENVDDSDLAGQDFFLGVESADALPAEPAKQVAPVQQSLLRTARQMIGDLPASALEIYELRYGPSARKGLTEAAGRRDWDGVGQVRRRYFHTQAGYEASVLLAQRELLHGHPLAASLLLDDVVASPHAVRHLGAGVTLMHAAALKLSGRAIADAAALPSGEVVVAGQPTPLPSPDQSAPNQQGSDAWSQWLDDRYSQLDSFQPAEPADYPMFGAAPDRNGTAAGQMPLTNFRWMLGTTASPSQERTLRQVTDELTTAGKLPPPSWMPIRVGDQLLMRTTERLVGVDYRTGKRLWVYPWQSAQETIADNELSFDEMLGEEDPADLISQRVWNDLPYGQVTSDGQRVFMLNDLGKVEMVAFSPMINLRGTRPADTSTNTLVALEMATEGKLLWRLGAGADEPGNLSDAFFLGPPLPVDGRLYVMVEIAGDINLVCLDPATGQELWRQHLVAVESGGIESDPIRRVAGATPTYHQGLLLCPTGAGATVAIDLVDRMLRWGVTYERNTEMIRSVSGRGRSVESNQLMQRWYSGAAVAADNALLLTPIESDRLLGFNLLTGETLFPEKNRVHMRYLAGIRDDRFFVVGTNQVRAFDLQSGTSLWTTPRDMLSAGQQIAGYGVFGEDDYLIPTTSNQLIQISLQDGSVLEKRNTRYPLGNLVALDGEIIAQGPTSLAVAFGEATLEPIVNQRLEQDPDDFDALVRKSELLIQRGQRDQALQLLARARQMQPDNDEVHMLSVSAMLGTLRENLDADEELIQTLDELIDRPAQRIELLSLRVRAALRRGDPVDAAARLLQLSTLLVSESPLETLSEQVVSDPARQCTLDSWIEARMDEIAGTASAQQLDQINAQLREAIDPRLESSTGLLTRINSHFGAFEGAAALRSELADRLRTDEDRLGLERLVLGVRIPTPEVVSELSEDERLALAGAYAEGGLAADALQVLQPDEQADSQETAGDGQAGQQLANLTADQIRQLAQAKLGSATWAQHVSVNWDPRQTRARTFLVPPPRVARTSVLAGRTFMDWQLVSDSTNPLALRDPQGNLRKLVMEGLSPSDDVEKEGQICGGAMVVLLPSELVAVDLYRLLAGDGDAILWRRGLSGDGGPVAKRRSSITPFDDQVVRYYIASSTASSVIPEFRLGPVMGDRVLVLQGGDLMAIDLITAETLWRNSDAPVSGAVLCDGNRVAVVSPATGEVSFFNIYDGRKLETKPWTHGEVWESIGTNVLAYSDADAQGMHRVALVDPFRDEVVLQHSALPSNRTQTDAPGSYGRVVAGRYLVMLDDGGRGLLWDLRSGRQLAQPQLPEYPDLQGLHAMVMGDRMFYFPKRRVDRARAPNEEQLQTTDGTFHRTLHGVHAVSMADGSVLWQQQFDQPWGVTLEQPAETPILMLTRSPFTYTLSSRRKSLEVLALDVADGSERSLISRPVQSNNNELETRTTVQPVLSRVIVQIGGELLTYTFTDQPPPPQEPPTPPIP